MKPLDRLSEYLGAIERRLRLLALTRGIAVTAGMALALTIVAVLVINQFAFSNRSVIGARVFLFLGLALAIAAALIVPVIRLNRRNAARRAEAQYPAVRRAPADLHRAHRKQSRRSVPGTAGRRHARVAQQAEPQDVAKSSWIYGFSSAAVVAALVLIWLGISGPGFLGYGTSLLVGGTAQGRQQAVLRHPGGPGQPHRAQTQRPDDHRAPDGLHRAQGALLRQVRQRLAVGAGRDGHGTGRHGLPVPDRRRAGERWNITSRPAA